MLIIDENCIEIHGKLVAYTLLAINLKEKIFWGFHRRYVNFRNRVVHIMKISDEKITINFLGSFNSLNNLSAVTPRDFL